MGNILSKERWFVRIRVLLFRLTVQVRKWRLRSPRFDQLAQLFSLATNGIRRVTVWVFRVMQYLLAPDLLLRITLRHLTLFVLMFFMPALFKFVVWPITRAMRMRFLYVTMGEDWCHKYEGLRAKLRECDSFEEFKKVADELDTMDGLYDWKVNNASRYYNYEQIRKDCMEIRDLLSQCHTHRERRKRRRGSRVSGLRSDVEFGLSPESNSQGINNTKLVPAVTARPAKLSKSFKSTRYAFEANIGHGNLEAHPMRILMEFLRSRVNRNYCGINHPKLYSYCRIGTKKLIVDFNKLLRRALRHIAETEDDEVTLAERLAFFRETRHVLGRTALCLSGGASLGVYHVGMVRALLKADIMPYVITGSSVGAVVAAFLGTKSKSEMIVAGNKGTINLKFFDRKRGRSWQTRLFTRLRRLWRTGNLLDANVLRNTLRDNLGDLTFQEAFDKTGRILNVTVTSTGTNSYPHLLNHLTAPNVVIWSAVMASSAVPFVWESQELHIKEEKVDPITGQMATTIHPVYMPGVRFSDGSIAADLPMQRLQQLFNVDSFVVSQVNPHIVPLLFHRVASPIPLFDRMFRYLGDEFSLLSTSLLVNLRELGLLRGFEMMNSVVTQKYTGDVTIVPDIPLSSYLNLLTNPTQEFVEHCITVSERSTWKLLTRLEGLCSIEVCLDECLSQLRQRAIDMQTKMNRTLRTRVSSFEAPIQRLAAMDHRNGNHSNHNNQSSFSNGSISRDNILHSATTDEDFDTSYEDDQNSDELDDIDFMRQISNVPPEQLTRSALQFDTWGMRSSASK